MRQKPQTSNGSLSGRAAGKASDQKNYDEQSFDHGSVEDQQKHVLANTAAHPQSTPQKPTSFLGRILGPNVRVEDLPQRVRDEIEQREGDAERLIGMVQLGVILFFALLYALAPRAEGAQGFNFVPYAIGGYMLFTIVRIAVSFKTRLPAWYLVISVFVDVALLVGLIFSFHIQYGQHPTFYLKAPTLMYVFLFISLRALRFDPRYVLLTGLLGAAGWLALVVYAMLSDMGGMLITRNYVEYLTSNSVLIGAELDKLIIIISVTLLLSLALLRGRRMFFSAVKEQAAVEDLSRFFVPEVASSIVEAGEELQAGQGESRMAAILFVDVRSFTSTSQDLTPEQTMAVLNCYQDAAVSVIRAHGGKIDKFLGDGILATFGAIEPSETFAADAINAALKLAKSIEQLQPKLRAEGWPVPMRIGCGVAAGNVTVGVVGAGERLEFTVIGDAVNRAAKFENANKWFGTKVLTDDATFSLASGQGLQASVLKSNAESIAGIGGTVELVTLA
ncbi:adenylate/guanylate cyclase domain-containing protein [Rhodobacteraceae bacterium RKSG542]|uniref:adenylate/guanylate cyclase domain-containing protein n=1 Tax=Pseudovibrio flavus TaxID=2529854 RepID=UPI0012BC5F05|nr:adenylate/guanylate cyclase domain-containing protein [Pseudovibrio flavus]MTI17020.1 adenylate/guanylate cyclase domain-containing protein [Pseudovibrio flavus]